MALVYDVMFYNHVRLEIAALKEKKIFLYSESDQFEAQLTVLV